MPWVCRAPAVGWASQADGPLLWFAADPCTWPLAPVTMAALQRCAAAARAHWFLVGLALVILLAKLAPGIGKKGG